MNAIVASALFFLLALSMTSAIPTVQYLLVEEPESANQAPHDATVALADSSDSLTEERANRQRRVTCDLMSISTKWVTFNHAACAAHCLAMLKGYRGGRCINGVCNCRK